MLGMQSFDPKLAGVHPSIEIDAGASETMPAYIPRGIDVKLRSLLLASEDKKFLLLLGSSSAGKTRAAYEGVRTTLPGYDVLLPTNTQEILWLLGQKLKRPTVVWLDELQRYLADGDGSSLDRGDLLALWSLNKPVIVVGTMWPDRYQSIVNSKVTDSLADKSDRARQLLSMAQVMYVEDELTPTELAAARELAQRDQRIEVALQDQHYGVTQVLAGAPDLVDRWTHASPRNRSVITAAVDIRRLGVSSPITDSLLRVAAQIYMSEEEMGRAPADWYESAIAYAVAPLKGATSALIPVARSVGAVDGYLLADYLTQHGERARASIVIPEPLWDIAANHVHGARDLEALGDAAQMRGFFKYAEGSLRRSLARGNPLAGKLLGMMLVEQERTAEALDVFKSSAATGHPECVAILLEYMEELAPAEALLELRKVADAGTQLPHHDARTSLAWLLYKSGDADAAEEEFQRSISEGRRGAHAAYAHFLERLGRSDEADTQFLLAARAGSHTYYEVSAGRQAERGRIQEAEALYQEASARGDAENSRRWWSRLLVKHGRHEDARKLGGPPGEVELHIGYCFKHSGDLAGALKMFLEADRLGNIWGQLEATELLEKQGRFDDAFTLRVKTAERLGSNWGFAGLVDHLARRDYLDVAVAITEAFAETGRIICSDDLGRALIRHGRIKEAMTMYKRSALSATDGSEVHSFLLALSENGYENLAALVRREGFGLPDDPGLWETGR
ncbi:hypothetical protein [Micromonospora sp. NPDC049497]|uniref:hypothetical protein n=1 Tax=Micromonospora sp. NPDC049497 TaxID=3364273 RepID=UPI0037AA1DA8